MTARLIKVGMMYAVALWGLLGGLGNLFDFAGGLGQVGVVLSMEEAQGASHVAWRAIHSPALIQLAFAVVYGAKFVTFALCLIGAVRATPLVRAPGAAFDDAKQIGMLGCAIGALAMFTAFIVIAGLHFEYWRVPTYGMITHHYAFIYTMCLTGFLIFIEQPDRGSVGRAGAGRPGEAAAA